METNKPIPLEEDYTKYEALKALQRDLNHAIALEEEIDTDLDPESRARERINFYRVQAYMRLKGQEHD